MISQLLGICKLQKLNINATDRVSGRITVRNYYQGGNVISSYGARFKGQAIDQVKKLQLGAIFRVVDGCIEDIPNRDGGSWPCIIIRDLEEIVAHPGVASNKRREMEL